MVFDFLLLADFNFGEIEFLVPSLHDLRIGRPQLRNPEGNSKDSVVYESVQVHGQFPLLIYQLEHGPAPADFYVRLGVAA